MKKTNLTLGQAKKRLAEMRGEVTKLSEELEKMILDESSKKPKPHSPRNGEIVRGREYDRIYDFNRDSWKNLVEKLYSPAWNCPERAKYLSAIRNKLHERINKGRCTLSEVDAYTETVLKGKLERNNVINNKISVSKGASVPSVTKIKARKATITINNF